MSICHACGVEAATRDVVFYRHIGLLIVGLTKSISRPLCARLAGSQRRYDPHCAIGTVADSAYNNPFLICV
jgi:hypothetical protein